MRKATTFLAITAIASQLAAPAMAADIYNSAYNPATALGWQRTTSTAAFAYVHMPLGATSTSGAPLRLGFAVTGPQAYRGGQVPLQLDGVHLVDVALTGRDLSAPWNTDSHSFALTMGNTVAWASNPDGLPPGEREQLFGGAWTWVAVGALTAGAVIGAFVLANRHE